MHLFLLGLCQNGIILLNHDLYRAFNFYIQFYVIFSSAWYRNVPLCFVCSGVFSLMIKNALGVVGQVSLKFSF